MLKRCLSALVLLAISLSSFSVYAATPTFSVAFSPTTMGPGTVSTMTYTIDNSANSVGVSDLAFTNTLPAGVTIAAAPDVLNTCTDGTFTATAGSSTITFSDYRLGLGSTCTFRVNVTSSTPGSHVNTTGTLSTSEGSVGAASATLTVDAARPGFSMAFSPATIAPGGTSTLTYTIDNSLNGSKADLLTFSHTLPTNLLVSADPNIVNTCSGGLVPTPVMTAAPETDSIQLQYGHVAAGSTCTISVNVSTNTTGSYTTETGDLSQNGANPSGSASSQLGVENSFLFANFPASASPGSSITLSFTINNLDRLNTASDITFTNDLNATLSGLTATALPADGFCGSGSTLTGSSTITVAGANLASEASCTFDVTVLVPANAAAGTYTNTTSSVNLTLDSATTKPAISNNLVIKKAPTITNLFIDDPVSASEDFTQRFVITNTDPDNAASSIALTQKIDDSLAGTVIKTLPVANSCGSGSTFTSTNDGTHTFLNISGANLAAGANCTFDVIMTAQAGVTPGSYAFTTSIPSATVSGATVYGLAASDTLVVVAAPALQLSINEESTTPDSTVTTDFTLTYSANATADATGVGFTVDLPAALTGMTATPSSQNDICGSGSSFTDNGSSLFTLSSATLSPGDSCTFSITMSVPAGAAPGTATLTSSTVTATTSAKSVSSATASDTLVISGLALSKTFVTNPVLPGDTTILRYTITNAATALAATSMQFSDNLASVITSLAATSLPTTPCGASSAMSGTANLSFSGGELLPGESCTFDVTVTVPVAASEGNYISVSSSMSATVNSSNTTTDAASATLVVDQLGVVLSSTASTPTSTSPIPVSIFFSRPVVNFVVGDITVGNGSASNFSGSGDTYTVDITPSADGNVTVDVAANVADDSVNGLVKNTAATQLLREYTATPATVTPSLVISSPSTSATNTGPVTYTVTYSDSETVNLTDSDITLNNTGTNATVTVTNGDTSTPTVTLSNISGDGTLGFSIAAGSARNGTETAPSAGPATTFSVDNTQPSVAITDVVNDNINAAFEATITFSEDVTGFVIGDISASNATLSSFSATSASVYKVTVTPTNQGAVTLNVASSVATDATGNSNTAAQHSVTYDSIAPSLSISAAATPQNAPFTATMTFGENVTGFDVSDISAANASLSNFAATSGSVYTVLVTPTADGSVTLDIAANTAFDVSGNGNVAATQYSVTYDNTSPTLTITGGSAAANGVFTATLTFSEAVDNFIITDITANNGSLNNFVANSSSEYSVEVTPAQEGIVTLDVSAGVATDTAGNSNSAASQFSKTLTPVISLTASTNTVSETNGSVTLTATSTMPAGADITVNLVYSGTATNGTDYVAGATSILIPASQSQSTTVVTITSDTLVETNETLIIDIDTIVGGATNNVLEDGVQQQTVTITDDDSVAVTLAASSSSIAEASGISTLTASLDKVTFEDVTINLGYSGTATSGSDYVASTASITITAGQTSGTATVTATSDASVEVVETIVVDITGVSGGSASESGSQQQTVSIIDDDNVAVTLAASASTIAEAAGSSTLTATLDKVTFEEVTVTLGYTGTASSGSDYTASAGAITITAGQTSGTATLTAISDTLVETGESIVIDITGVNGGSASESGSQQQTVTITDDDSIAVTLTASTSSVTEAAGTSILTATLDKVSFEDVTVSLGYTGTASSGIDYATPATSITITTGQISGSATLTATSDTLVEASETVVVDITGVSGGSASESGTQQQTVIITDDDSALVTLTVSDSSIAEAAGTSTIIANLDKVTFEDVTVSLGYTGTATSGSDYAVSAGSITITAGQTSGSVILTATSDSSIETDETVIVDVTGVSGGSASESGSQQKTVTILDDDTVAVTLTASSSSMAEAAGTSTLTATLDKITIEDVVVSLSYTGTASSGTDYVTPAGSITIAAGQTSGSVTLTATSDTAVEADETIIADISGVSGGSANENGTQQQTVTIIDDDSTVVSLTVSASTIGETAGSSTLTVTLDKATFEPVVVSLGYTGTATHGSDYLTQADSITIAAGQTTNTIALITTSDTLVEANETIIVDITGVTGGFASENNTQQQTVTITDDDSAVVTLAVSTSAIAEAAGTSTLTATLDKATFEDVTVSLGYTGTATSGSDYATPAGAITISAGQTTGSATLTAISDPAIETDETIIVDVTGVNGGSASESGLQQKTVTILDDDTVAVTLTASSSSIAEASGSSILTATLDKVTIEDVVVSLSYTGTASSGTDYVTPAGSITIAAGQTSGSVTLTALSDSDVEADETIIADISGVSGGSANESGTQQQTVTIIDDDSSVVSLTVSASTIGETAGSSTLTASLDKATFEAVVVSLGYTGTATNGSDYVTPADTITIVAGQTTSTATLVATSDTLVEANETIIVDITGVNGGFASENNTQQQTVTITDDDTATVTLLVSNSSIAEAGTSTLTAILNKPTFEDVVISLEYAGTASASDYTKSADAITVTAGQTTGTVTLTAVQDSTEESDETIIVDISGVSGGSVSEQGTQQQTVIISNDDNETSSDVATVDEDNSIQIDVLSNDQGPGGTLNPASVSIYTAATNGVTSINTANGFITYTPTSDYNGVDTFAYIVNDLQGNTSAPTTVTVTVNNVNDAPVAVNDAAAVIEDNSLTVDVLANDLDVDGASDINLQSLTVTIQPEHGQASVADGKVIYTPEANYNGSDIFSYKVDDNAGLESNTAIVSINVSGANDAPTTQSDTATTNEDTAVTISVLHNDTDVDGQLVASSVTTVAQPSNGLAEAQTDGSIIYTPNDNFFGSDTFTYTVKDAENAVSAATEVTVTVQGVNDAPVASDDIAVLLEDTSFDINVAGNDNDIDSDLDASSLVIVSMPAHGSVSLINGLLHYTPVADFGGNDSFSYTISDIEGSTSNVATVTITVDAVNDLPIANNDSAVTEEDSSVTIDLLANDQDVDGSLDPASIALAQSESLPPESVTSLALTQPDNGSVTIDTSTGVATYTPNADFNGVDTFRYSVSDNEGGVSNTATVTIQISSVNDTPVISGTPLTTVLEGGDYRFTPLISDVDNDSLTTTASNLPGWLTLDPSTGELQGSPTVGDAGVYADIVVQVSDGEFNAELAAFSIEVVGDNDTDGIANHEDTDDDNDGMSDEFELANGFNPFNSADAAEDADNDGLSNLEEALQSSNPLLDDQAPVIASPEPLEFNATGLLTQVSGFDIPTAVDGLDGEVAVNLLGESSLNLAPGRHQLTWFATDAAGNRAEVQQQVDVHPLISLSSGQIVGEGFSGRIEVILNGAAPEYPVTISYELEGSANSEDHNLTAGSVTFEEDELAGGIPFVISQDDVTEGIETLVVVLTGDGNFDANNRHTLSIVEDNVAPRVGLSLVQNGSDRLIIEQGGGLVSFTSTVNDPNPNDQHTIEWDFSDGVTPTFVTDLQRQLNPADLAPGIYSVTLSVTDNGTPAITNEVNLSYRVVEALAALSETQDSDNDGIADIDEGWADDDQDGQPNYLDAISLSNVLNSAPEDGFSFLLEADPGVKMVLGERALSNDGRGAKLDTDALPEEMALPEDSFNNLSGYFDFVVNELPLIGQSVNVVIAQSEPIPENAIYRKFDGVWFTFVENASNSVMSAPGEEGHCPSPQAEDYRSGLNEGDWCVQLTIEDGGPNDADGLANGSINDPGGVGVNVAGGGETDPGTTQIRSSGSGGGSVDLSLIMLLLSLLAFYGTRWNHNIRLRRPWE
ncbi:beta strand repeat-containing protein [Litoribacillus peritrichatus]|uniref:Uncharacterized protein n=1 Tax=Litoribacillus peritrichatus TaxID=718191 RepID=A0ABP7N8H3_9GAMM